MPIVTLPDGSIHKFENPISVYGIASSISKKLAQSALAGIIDGNIEVDVNFTVNKDSTLTLITLDDDKGLEILRHSCAHLLAQAVKQLFPSSQIAIGPVVKNGFYYDFSYKRSFTLDDLDKIEKKMHELASEGTSIIRTITSRQNAIAYFNNIGEYYKIKIIEKLPVNESLSLYTQGNFTDLCKGPHVPNTSYLKAFKLMRVAGAYWMGNSKNEMLTRIYGTCWADEKQLKNYLIGLEEAEKRDHRKIGKTLNLFHFQEESPGIAFWHHNGTVIWHIVENYLRTLNEKYEYKEIKTPLIADVSMWEKSGHVAKYSDNIFLTNSEGREYAIRPMNCPTCVQVYNHQLHSYRNLPIRMTEFGLVHRNETSGSLHGLFRVRSFTQDDGHIFCTENHIEFEVAQIIKQCFEVYNNFGFSDVEVKLALRPDNRVGSDENWEKAEKTLEKALNNQKITFEYLPGEGAFYGPKIEFHLKDAIGRSWQCGTIQLDFSMPNRLDARYIDESSQKKVPIMIHRAIVGSIERFIGIIIEHHSGKLPIWLAPVQIVIIGVNNNQDQYLKKISQKLRKFGIRTQIDLRNEKIGFKIREHSLTRVPFIAIAGEREQSLDQITIRKQDGSNLGMLTVDMLVDLLLMEIEKKGQI